MSGIWREGEVVGMNWIDLAKNRDTYWAFVNAIMKLMVS
jgi:hypothetical protein